jgi:hypothetical protein
MIHKRIVATAPETPGAEGKPKKNIGRPPLTEEQKAERDAKKKGDTRDSVRIYLTPLQFAYLEEYHAKGGTLKGETIRLAIDRFFDYLIDTKRFKLTEAVSPENAQLAWEERQKKKPAEEGEDK